MPNPTYQPGDLVRYTARDHLIEVGTICRISEDQDGVPNFTPDGFTYWVDIPFQGSNSGNVQDGWWKRRYWCDVSYFEMYRQLPNKAEEDLKEFIDKLRQT